MPVIYPCHEHTQKLVSYASLPGLGCRKHQSEDITHYTPSQNAIYFSDEDVTLLRQTCDTIVAEVNQVLPFFTAGGVPDESVTDCAITEAMERSDTSDTASRMHSTSSSIDVSDEEHVRGVRFPEGSLAQLLRGRTKSGAMSVPLAFYESHLGTFTAMRGALLKSRSALQSINASHAFVWSANATVIRKYVHMLDNQRGRTHSMYDPAPTRSVLHRSDATAHPPSLGRPIRDEQGFRYAVDGHGMDSSTKAPEGLTSVLHHNRSTLAEETESSNTEPQLSRSVTIVKPVVSSVSTQLLATLSDDLLPTPSVYHAYATFIQACDALLEWLDVSVMLSTRQDIIPREGSYLVPLSEDSKPSRLQATESTTSTSATADAAVIATSLLSQQSDTSPLRSTAVPAQASRSRVVHIRRFTVHDVRHIYDALAQQVAALFGSNHTQYNSYICRNILQPTSLSAASDLLTELAYHIQRLEDIAARRISASALMEPDMFPYDLYSSNLACGAAPVYPCYSHSYTAASVNPTTTAALATYSLLDPLTSSSPFSSVAPPSDSRTAYISRQKKAPILFRPSLSSFRALRTGLRVYVGVSMTVDDNASLSRYRVMYDEVTGSVHKLVHVLQTLPKPPLANKDNFVHALPSSRPTLPTLSTNVPARANNPNDNMCAEILPVESISVPAKKECRQEDTEAASYAHSGNTANSMNLHADPSFKDRTHQSVFLCNEMASTSEHTSDGVDGYDRTTASCVQTPHLMIRRTNSLSVLQTQAAVPAQQVIREWMSKLAERDMIYSAFKFYWSVRESVRCMRSGLANNIQSKNKTHRTYRGVHAVRNERDAFAIHAEKWYLAHMQLRRGNDGIGSTVWRVATSSLKLITDLLACKAELGGGADCRADDSCQGSEDDRSSMTTTSPFCAEKCLLMSEVNRMWDVIEIQGLQLERTYMGLFHRSPKAKWINLFETLLSRSSTMPVMLNV